MLFLEYSNYSQSAINENFGAPEYSYWFVRRAFRRVLEKSGTRVEIVDPDREVDQIYAAARERGEPCVFLPFCPPNTTPISRTCPTIPVFAWEYDTLPDETWNDNPAEDWTWVLKRAGMAITHCQYAAKAVRRSMGKDFPVWVIPAPLFDKHKRPSIDAKGWHEPFDLILDGGLAIDAGDVDLTLFRPERPKPDGIGALRALDNANQDKRRLPQVLRLDGVIYTTVLNPYDGRKNWRDLISGFVWAFRETPSATLLVKLTRFDVEDGVMPVLQLLSTLGPFACRVVLIHGLLSEEAYRGLIDWTSYAVNASFGEGQCLPLMEYMSAGRPSVAPAHTAMLDYVSPENSFVIESRPRITHWPHDERAAKRCMQQQISFTSLVRQYRESYRVARDAPEQYARMAAAAVESLRGFCSDEVVLERLGDMVKHVEALQHETAGAN
jgi:glycosyltransferase involved in cell wall biosynthesis